MKTAVEWLIDELRNKHGMPIDLYSEFQQAKEMEKEQIVLTHINGQSEFDKGAYRQEVINNAEQYYNETFKQEQ